jgi:uncharacterized protein HemX
MTLIVAALLLLVVLLAGLALLGSVQGQQTRLAASERAELRRLKELVEELKEIAWDHREIDPDLATIVIDTIRASDRGA